MQCLRLVRSVRNCCSRHRDKTTAISVEDADPPMATHSEICLCCIVRQLYMSARMSLQSAENNIALFVIGVWPIKVSLSHTLLHVASTNVRERTGWNLHDSAINDECVGTRDFLDVLTACKHNLRERRLCSLAFVKLSHADWSSFAMIGKEYAYTQLYCWDGYAMSYKSNSGKRAIRAITHPILHRFKDIME